MRTSIWITVICCLGLLGCAQSDVNQLPSSTTNPERIKVSKPAIGGGQTPATAATEGQPDHIAQPAQPDNTAVNRRDREPRAVVPTDQGNSQSDLDATAEIRRRILRNTAMSLKGQNVKVITVDGKVTLRGPVASAEERKIIEQIARDVAGPSKVNSELEVAP